MSQKGKGGGKGKGCSCAEGDWNTQGKGRGKPGKGKGKGKGTWGGQAQEGVGDFGKTKAGQKGSQPRNRGWPYSCTGAG